MLLAYQLLLYYYFRKGTWHIINCSLSSLLLKLFFFIGISFARIIGAVFYVPLFVFIIGPSWIVRYMAKNKSPVLEAEEGAYCADMPEGWCRVKICRTDEISYLELEPWSASDYEEDGHNTKDGEWENREIFAASKEEIERNVWVWLHSVDGGN